MASLSVDQDTVSAAEMPWLKVYPAKVDWSMPLGTAPVFRLLEDAAAAHPDNVCTTFLGRQTSYADIAKQVDRAAARLQQLGVKKGVKVGLLLPNSPTFIVYYYAALKAGGVVVNFNPLYTHEELVFQARDSETEVMVTLDLKVLFDKVEGLLRAGVLRTAVVCSFPATLPPGKSILFRLFKAKDLARPGQSAFASLICHGAEVEASDVPFAPVEVSPDDLAVLQYTGGTTGTPKGAMLTHGNLYVNVQQVRAWAPDLRHGEERVLGVLPFFHVFAMTVVMNLGIALAAEIVIMPRFVLDEALGLIAKLRPTIMPGVPTLFGAIMNHPNIKGYDLRCLKFCLSGGAPLPVEVRQKFEANTGCLVVEGYGLSETSPVATCNPLHGPVKVGAIGLPLPGTRVSLRDLTDPSREVGRGERGEICIAGPQVMLGYWKRPAETAQQFAGGYFRTGDVGVMDDDGFFSIVDRIKDLIICSGYNVYPRRIEEALYEHEAVEECTVIGVVDRYRGEAPKAFVKLRAGASASHEDLMRHLEVKLSRIELPAAIEFRDQLPKTMIGKLSKKELKSEEQQRLRT